MKTILLDTTVIIHYLRLSAKDRSEETLLEQLTKQQDLKLAISTMTILEIFQGQSTKRSEPAALVRETLLLFTVFPLTSSIAELAGTFSRDYPPLEVADATIAATAISHGISLFTNNRKDFDTIPQLLLYTPEPELSP